MKRLTGFLLGIIITMSLQAQDFENTDKISEQEYTTGAFGLHAGTKIGAGASYRHWFDRAGVQVTFLPLQLYPEEFLSIGLSGLYSTEQTENMNVFGYLSSYLLITERDINHHIGAGSGFAVGKPVTFNMQAGYGLYFSEGDYEFLPAVEIGLYYRFRN